jgi:hypothetical protein
MRSLLPRWAQSASYNPLRDESQEPLTEKGQEEGQIIERHRPSLWSSNTLPWMISTLVFASLSFYLYLNQPKACVTLANYGSFEKGFSTELASAKSQIVVETQMFTGTPLFTDKGAVGLDLDPNEPLYVGEASDDIDDNWVDFIGGKHRSTLGSLAGFSI